MSTKVMAACWPLKLPPTAKAVLISLADNANDHGHCWPSIDAIAERTCCNRRTVIRAIETLEAWGCLVADRSNGRHSKYQVTPEGYAEPVTQSHQLADANQCHKVTGDTESPVTQSPKPVTLCPKPVTQSHSNRKNHQNRKEIVARPPDVEDSVWRDWLALRKKKRAPVTETALEGFRKGAEAASLPLQTVLKMMCTRGWQGFEPEWVSKSVVAKQSESRAEI